MNKLTIGIVGGSIAGCSAAILLGREGHTVRVFERSTGRLVGRGGGIGTPGPLLEALVQEDVIDADFPHLTCSAMPFIVRTPEHERLGYSPWQMPMDLRTFQWSALWSSLRRRVPDDVYHQGYEVVNARTNGSETVTLQFKDGPDAEVDLVLFADGYQSVGRQLLFPNSGLNYRGYVLWRGLLPEGEMDDSVPLGSNVPRLSYPDLPGNFEIYFVPSQDGRLDKGHRIFNWAAYLPLSEAELPGFMVDREGIYHPGSIPPGKMRLEEEDRLKQLLCENLPTCYGDIVARTRDTHVQLIYTAHLPAYHHARIALIGDAGMVVQPFTGSGVFKGYHNVKDLLEAFHGHETIDDALRHWGTGQVRLGNRLLALGEQMEQAFIWKTLDLATADAGTTAAWWKQAVTFPEDFTYEADKE